MKSLGLQRRFYRQSQSSIGLVAVVTTVRTSAKSLISSLVIQANRSRSHRTCPKPLFPSLKESPAPTEDPCGLPSGLSLARPVVRLAVAPAPQVFTIYEQGARHP
ncbi:hypothetical protein PGT21_023400 [Puccinia graminis f. sp. tritici]|uniref:Uncharacterized protein n=1 Tax=Puccinia graminis f. sp. tritici TaxID=56615 RepID=A0A5B0QBN1_PUCGR|nr:hypothetical protein PGT21_023400 [Puccinia graminis f. sp. tritici]